MKNVVNIDTCTLYGFTTAAVFIGGNAPHDLKARIVGGTRLSSIDQCL